jgi:4-hydroxybenzoate polyprenyltransferase
MNKILNSYHVLFVSACNLSKKIKADDKPHEIAYWLISFYNMANFATMLLLLKFLIGINLEIGKVFFILSITVPFFIINYYIFLKDKKYRKIMSELEKTTSYVYFIIYAISSILLFAFIGYLNL